MYANLIGACLRGADLSGADLSSADLRGTDLRGTELEECIKIPMYCRWSHGVTDGMIHIGCEKRTIEEWDKFFASDKVLQTPRGTEEFKQIEAVYLAYKAYLQHLNTNEK
jgi:hypothetical protein